MFKIQFSVVLTTLHKFCTYMWLVGLHRWRMFPSSQKNSGRLLSDSSGVGHKPGGVFSRGGDDWFGGSRGMKKSFDIMMAKMKILWVEGRGVGS